jgi:hypothetical protein
MKRQFRSPKSEFGSSKSESDSPQSMKGQLFVISGATSDVGCATARLLVASGAKVELGDIKLIALAELSNELRPNAKWTMVDVTDERAVDNWLTHAPTRWGMEFIDGMWALCPRLPRHEHAYRNRGLYLYFG